MTDDKSEKAETVETTTLAAPATSPTIEMIIASAVEQKLPAAELKELLALEREMRADRAKQAFIRAMAEFQATCPPIPRNHKAEFATRKGTMAYDYASLPDVVAVIDPILKPLGLYYRWPSASEAAGKLTVTCEISHVEGHSETSSYVVPVESSSGASPQQKYGSAGTYCKRQVLIMALALGTVDPDDDGCGDQPAETITDDQVRQIEGLLDGINDAKEYKRIHKSVLDYIERDRFADCPAAQFGRVMNKLERSLQAQEGT